MLGESKLVALKDYCAVHDIDYRRARRAARKDKFPGAFQALGRWAIDKDVAVPTLPERGTFGRPARADGRRPFKVYLTAEEATTLTANGFEMTDPRVARKERKAAKAAEAAAANIVA